MDMLLKVQESACTKDWCWTGAGSPARQIDAIILIVHAALASAVPQQGHLAARNSPTSKKFLPTAMNSDAGITLAESTGLALKKAVALVPIDSVTGPWPSLSYPSLLVSHL